MRPKFSVGFALISLETFMQAIRGCLGRARLPFAARFLRTARRRAVVDATYSEREDADQGGEKVSAELPATSGLIFPNNPIADPAFQKIWQTSVDAKSIPVARIQALTCFADVVGCPDVTMYRSADPPAVFTSSDVIPVHTVVNILRNNFCGGSS